MVVTLLFGTAFPAVKAGLEFFPPLLFVAARNYLAAVVLLSYAALATEHRRPQTRADWGAVLAGGVFLVGGVAFGFVGQQFITAGVAAIIFSLSPVVTAVLAWVLLPAERLSRRDVVGVLVGFLGVAIVVDPDPAALLDPTLVGKMLVFVGTAVVALGTVLIRRSRTELFVPALTGWSMVLGATLQTGAAVALGESVAAVRLTPFAIGAMLYLGIVIGAVGLVLFLVLLGEVGAVRANLTTYLIPVVAIAVGWLFLSERVAVTAVVGFAVILVGFSLLEGKALFAELAKYRALAR